VRTDEFLADVAAIYARGPTGEAFGSGRLIAPGLILTAGHVVDHPTRQSPLKIRWKVCLIGERSSSGIWTNESAHDAELIWRGDNGVDLALLRIIGGAKAVPIVQPVFVSHDIQKTVPEVDSAGFPQAWRTENDAIRDYTLSGQLRNASQQGPYGWAVQPADKPDNRDGWKGMSGGGVCKIGRDDKLLLFGAVQSVPANFSGGLLDVARLSDAFLDKRFYNELWDCLGYEPQIIPFDASDTNGAPALSVVTALPGPIVPDAPDLPPGYRPRETDIAALKSLLIGGEGNIGIVGRSRAAGLRGMGGLGKTVLATVLIQDPEVRKAFSYGIVWLTFGREANALTQLTVLARAVTGQQPGYTAVPEARADLARILGDRRLLLVLDDVWDPALVDGFRNLAPGCHLLITTRDQSVLDRAQARSHPIGLLDLPASRALFAEVLGSTDLPKEAASIIAECGGLPLALVAAASMARRKGWPDKQDAFARVQDALARGRLDVLKLKWMPGSEHENLAVVLAASVEALPDRERACFLTCATWPEDVPIPTSALDLYWSAHAPDPLDQDEIVDALADASVLQRDANGMLRLHDLYHDYLRHRAGKDLAVMHGAIADRCVRVTDSGCQLLDASDWTLARLPWHLVQASRPLQAKALLLDYCWLASKLATHGVQAIITDTQLIADGELEQLGRALRLPAHVLAGNRDQLAAQLIGRLHDQVDTATTRLLASAVSSLPANVLVPRNGKHLAAPGALVATLSDHTDWSMARCCCRADAVPSPGQTTTPCGCGTSTAAR
jgi:hypothetical protein